MLLKLLLPSPVRLLASPVHRALLLSTAASPVHFAAEDYLVTTCGLTKEQAAKAAKYIAHCKSPSKADAVLSFLASPDVGLSKDEIASVVSNDARILNCRVDTIRPRIAALLNHGFTAAQIRTFIRCCRSDFFHRNVDEKLGFWLPFAGSPDKFLTLLKRSSYLFTSDIDGAVKPKIQVLRDAGLGDARVVKICLLHPRLLTTNTAKLRAMIRPILTRAQDLGFSDDSPMFWHAVAMLSKLGLQNVEAKLKFIGETLGCSDAEVANALKKAPHLPAYSRERLHRISEFLTKVVGLDGKYIISRPTLLSFSLDRRIAPRHYVMKVLMEKRLMRKDPSFYTFLCASDKLFQSRYIIPHKDVLPGLADAYASACKGKLPTL